MDVEDAGLDKMDIFEHDVPISDLARRGMGDMQITPMKWMVAVLAQGMACARAPHVQRALTVAELSSGNWLSRDPDK